MEPFGLPPGITVGEIPPFSPYNADQIERLRMQEAFRAEQAAREAARAARPSPLSAPKTFGELFSPGTKAAAGAVAGGLSRAGGATLTGGKMAARGAGALALPALETYREREQLFGEDANALDRVAAAGRMAVRGIPAAAGSIIGGIGGARLAGRPGAIGGSLAGGYAGYKIGDEFLNLIGANTPASQDDANRELLTETAYNRAAGVPEPAPAALPPSVEATPQNTFGVLASQANPAMTAAPVAAAPSTLPARQRAVVGGDILPERPALAGAATQQPIDYNAGELFSPEAKAQIDKIAGRNEELSNLSKQYFQAQGMREPRGLTTSDKLQILAKGLGTAALIAAFPGAGLLMALGGGLVGGVDETGNRRAANAAADQQDFANTSAIFDQQRKLMADQMKADQDILGQTNEAYGARFNRNAKMAEQAMEERKFAEDALRFGKNYALRQRELSQRAALARNTGLVPIVGPDGKTRLMRPTEGMEVPATYGLRQTSSQSYVPSGWMDAVTNEANAIFSEAKGKITRAEAFEAARATLLRGMPAGVGGARPPSAATARDTRDTMSDEDFAARY